MSDKDIPEFLILENEDISQQEAKYEEGSSAGSQENMG